MQKDMIQTKSFDQEKKIEIHQHLKFFQSVSIMEFLASLETNCQQTDQGSSLPSQKSDSVQQISTTQQSNHFLLEVHEASKKLYDIISKHQESQILPILSKCDFSIISVLAHNDTDQFVELTFTSFVDIEEENEVDQINETTLQQENKKELCQVCTEDRSVGDSSQTFRGSRQSEELQLAKSSIGKKSAAQLEEKQLAQQTQQIKKENQLSQLVQVEKKIIIRLDDKDNNKSPKEEEEDDNMNAQNGSFSIHIKDENEKEKDSLVSQPNLIEKQSKEEQQLQEKSLHQVKYQEDEAIEMQNESIHREPMKKEQQSSLSSVSTQSATTAIFSSAMEVNVFIGWLKGLPYNIGNRSYTQITYFFKIDDERVNQFDEFRSLHSEDTFNIEYVNLLILELLRSLSRYNLIEFKLFCAAKQQTTIENVIGCSKSIQAGETIKKMEISPNQQNIQSLITQNKLRCTGVKTTTQKSLEDIYYQQKSKMKLINPEITKSTSIDSNFDASPSRCDSDHNIEIETENNELLKYIKQLVLTAHSHENSYKLASLLEIINYLRYQTPIPSHNSIYCSSSKPKASFSDYNKASNNQNTIYLKKNNTSKVIKLPKSEEKGTCKKTERSRSRSPSRQFSTSTHHHQNSQRRNSFNQMNNMDHMNYDQRQQSFNKYEQYQYKKYKQY